MMLKMLQLLSCPYCQSKFKKRLYICVVLLVLPFCILPAQGYKEDSAFVRDHYIKRELLIPMRDGVKLFTSIYLPKDSSIAYPFMLSRTPYSVAPYGLDHYRYRLGPNPGLMREKYIFVYQDVRGRYKSEGVFEEMTPHRENKKTNKDTDESSDSYDTVEWLLKNISRNNGRVGIWGISYPGFYASASLPEAHPAIKAVSPQAPVTDEFIGDDAYHKGAFFLMDNFGFINHFDQPRKGPVEDYGDPIFNVNYSDAYRFFLELGPISNANKPAYFNNRSKIWNEYIEHDSYDAYWKARNTRIHFNNIKPAVLVTGGWFDAEDLFGALETYRAIEKNNPVNHNRIVMGPWTHGAWSAGNWSQFATHDFRQNTSKFYQDEMETPFFNEYLKDKGPHSLPEAYIFETGRNEWKKYTQWPPENMQAVNFYLQQNGALTTSNGTNAKGYSEYTSDPARPVPYTSLISRGRNNEYMSEDQRFASRRPDVLVFVTEPLEEDITLAGPVTADLLVSMTGTDADFIVKLIDVLPPGTPNPSPNPKQIQMGGLEQLVRAEVFRGKFRESFEKPVPFVPGKITEIKYALPDVAHRFLKGHRIMVQVQSTWFPLVDRNPQKFMHTRDAKDADFIKSTIRIYHEEGKESKIILPVLK